MINLTFYKILNIEQKLYVKLFINQAVFGSDLVLTFCKNTKVCKSTQK